MFPLIFAILLTPILAVKYYETVRYKDRLGVKNWLFLVLSTLVVVFIYLEKVFKITV
jgi:hypothetical protein